MIDEKLFNQATEETKSIENPVDLKTIQEHETTLVEYYLKEIKGCKTYLGDKEQALASLTLEYKDKAKPYETSIKYYNDKIRELQIKLNIIMLGIKQIEGDTE